MNSTPNKIPTFWAIIVQAWLALAIFYVGFAVLWLLLSGNILNPPKSDFPAPLVLLIMVLSVYFMQTSFFNLKQSSYLTNEATKDWFKNKFPPIALFFKLATLTFIVCININISAQTTGFEAILLSILSLIIASTNWVYLHKLTAFHQSRL